MGFFSKTPLSIKDAWKMGFELYRKTFAKIWYLALPLGLSVMFVLYINTIYSGTDEVPNVLIAFSCSVIISLLVVFLSSLVLYQIYSIGSEKNYYLSEGMLYVKKRYWKLLGCMIVVVILYSLGGLLLVLPGIFLFVLLAMAQLLVLFDDKKVFQSIGESSKLVWGNWWRSFAIIFPFLLVNYWMIYDVNASAKSGSWVWIVIDLLLSIAYYPFYYSCLLVLFNDLKLRKNKTAEAIIVT